jgi:DNA invertase Pin-like site-specific DNA recombinase
MHRYFIYCRKSTENDDTQALSLESQERELRRYAAEHVLEIADIIMESRTARLPGRPLFSAMLQRIARGEAHGILAWHPDRLSRNAVDGGQIIHYLDTGKLRDLRFPTFIFDNNPQGKFMLMVVFGHAKYEVDILSELVKRGNRTKRELGWFPGKPPLGYLNIRSDAGAKIIGRDPERFPAIKKLWELFLTGTYSGIDLLEVATSDMGLRSRRTWRAGGGPVSRTAIYKILRNPFYTGHIVFKGNWFPANHEAMVSVEAFNRAQGLLRGLRVRPRSYRFAYTKLIHCGCCGCFITAQRKKNRYTYYHCTRANKSIRCREPYLEERELERQMIEFFRVRGYESSLINQSSLRALLILRTSSLTIENKRLSITLKVPA